MKVEIQEKMAQFFDQGLSDLKTLTNYETIRHEENIKSEPQLHAI